MDLSLNYEDWEIIEDALNEYIDTLLKFGQQDKLQKVYITEAKVYEIIGK